MLKRIATIASFPSFVLAARLIPFDELPSTCVFYQVTGYPCPSCGMTRSVMALVRLDLLQAVAFNPLGIVFMVVLALSWVIAVYQAATGRQTRIARWASRNMNSLIITGLVVLFLFGAVRIWMLVNS